MERNFINALGGWKDWLGERSGETRREGLSGPRRRLTSVKERGDFPMAVKGEGEKIAASCANGSTRGYPEPQGSKKDLEGVGGEREGQISHRWAHSDGKRSEVENRREKEGYCAMTREEGSETLEIGLKKGREVDFLGRIVGAKKQSRNVLGRKL